MKRYYFGLAFAAAVVTASVAAYLLTRRDNDVTTKPEGMGHRSDVKETVAPVSEEEIVAAIRTVQKEAESRHLKQPVNEHQVPPHYGITDQAVIDAISICRRGRKAESISALVRIADLPNADPKIQGRSFVEYTPFYISFPAASALVAIGEECGPEIVKAISQEPPPNSHRYRSWILPQVLADIFGEEEAGRLLSAEMANLGESDIEERKRLTASLERLRRSCASSRPFAFKEWRDSSGRMHR